jgi:formyltetrahydrofolate deformylase
MTLKKFIMTLSCEDSLGIVAKVSTFLAENRGFILELAQFGDLDTGQFFMRSVFDIPLDAEELTERFQPVAKSLDLKWELHDSSIKPRVLLLVSTQGHCLNDLLHRASIQTLPIEIVAVASNHQNLREMTEWYKVPFFFFPTSLGKEKQEEQILSLIDTQKVELTVLARYMQILSSNLSHKLYGKAINIHHSFLPSFKGAKPYHQAFERGVKLIGATAHYVSDELDEGPIIEQEVLRVDHTHTAEQLVELGKDIERIVLARAIKYHTEQRVFLNGRKTVIFK